MARQVHVHRNFGIIAHIDAGKTTLTERILYLTGLIHRMGEVHEGTTATDDSPISRRKGITVRAAAVTSEWRGHRLQLVDTPGHVDFTVEVERSLRVLDGAVVVLDAVAGVEPQTETVWAQAARHGVPCIAFINKVDRPGADVELCLAGLRERLGVRPALISTPLFEEGRLVGIVDVVEEQVITWSPGGDGRALQRSEVPRALAAEVSRRREALLYALAEDDDGLADAVLSGRTVSARELVPALRRATIAGRVVPVACGSAYQKIGVQPLLDAIVDLLPSPLDRPPIVGEGGEVRRPSDEEPFAALVFKVVHSNVGPMNMVRVYSGAIERGAEVACVRTGRRWRVGRILRMFASDVEDLERVGAGEIAAIPGGQLRTGDTLTAPEHPIVLEPVRVPEPVVHRALAAKTQADLERLDAALAKLTVEDPSLSVKTDAETGELVLSGIGELQLETVIERLRTEHGVDVVAGRPEVAYRETLAGTAEVEHLHRKQSGGPGQFAKVRLRAAPAARGQGLVFDDRTVGGVLPAALVAAIERGVAQAMASGPKGGHPVVDVHVEVLDGETHVKDSSALAFEIAGRQAFELVLREAGTVVLEPIMEVDVRVPEASLGRTLADVQQRRGRVVSHALFADRRRVIADVPLASLFGYADALRSLTQGRAEVRMRLVDHRPV